MQGKRLSAAGHNSYGNGIRETRSYDADGRLDCRQIGSAPADCLDYDANGNLLSNPAANASYHYDALDRLDQQTVDAVSQSYSYDENGNGLNRTAQASAETYVYAGNSNRLVQRTGQNQGLDAIGNQTSDGNDAYRYNRRGQLNRFYRNNQQLSAYTVNALGQWALKTLASGKIVYQFGLQGELLAEITKDALSGTGYAPRPKSFKWV